MNLAYKEIKHSKGKYALIEGILLLMVLFLSGLANGLARAVSNCGEGIPEEKLKKLR